MWMDYMDYTDDRCMYFFSDGQVSRADFFIDTDLQLNSIINSACNTITSNTSNTNGSNAITNSSRIIGSSNLFLYPTITPGELTLITNSAVKENAELNIYNQTGSLVMKQRLLVAEGNSSKAINVSKLGDGIYILQLSTGAEKKTAKFVVHH